MTEPQPTSYTTMQIADPNTGTAYYFGVLFAPFEDVEATRITDEAFGPDREAGEERDALSVGLVPHDSFADMEAWGRQQAATGLPKEHGEARLKTAYAHFEELRGEIEGDRGGGTSRERRARKQKR
jgi:hypothetical protein